MSSTLPVHFNHMRWAYNPSQNGVCTLNQSKIPLKVRQFPTCIPEHQINLKILFPQYTKFENSSEKMKVDI